MAQYVAEKVDPGTDPRLRKLPVELGECHNWLLFRDYYEAGEVRLHRTISCRKHLLCPLCAILRAAKAVRHYHERFEVIKAENPALRVYYVVLTVKNGPDLAERFAHAEKSMRLLVARRRDALKARKGSRKHVYALNSAFAAVEGGAYSFEVKRGEGSGLWHPHVNILLLSEGEIDARELAAEWESITGDSFITYCAEKPPDDRTVFVEIFKYAMKFSEMECRDTFEAYTTLRRRRLFGSFGVFRGVKVPEGEEDEALDSPYVELVYRYARGGYRSRPEKGERVIPGGVVDAGGKDRECRGDFARNGSAEGERVPMVVRRGTYGGRGKRSAGDDGRLWLDDHDGGRGEPRDRLEGMACATVESGRGGRAGPG
jgi:hypothetical protein